MKLDWKTKYDQNSNEYLSGLNNEISCQIHYKYSEFGTGPNGETRYCSILVKPAGQPGKHGYLRLGGARHGGCHDDFFDPAEAQEWVESVDPQWLLKQARYIFSKERLI